MEALARQIIQEGQLANAEHTFEINGRSMTTEEATRYFRRKGFQSLEAAVGHSKVMASEPMAVEMAGECPTHIRCSEIYIKVTLLFETELQVEQWRKQKQEADSSTTTGSESGEHLPSPSFSLAPESTELVLRMLKVYYNGCCQTNLWYTCTAGRFRTRRPVIDAARVLDSFVGFWITGLKFAKSGSLLDCNRALFQAAQGLQRIILAEDPSTVRALLEMLLEYAKAGHCSLAVSVLKQVVGLCSVDHPLAIICRQILRVQPGDAERMALAALACGADTLATQCGEYHYSVVRCRVALITSKSTYLDKAQVAELANRLLVDFANSEQFTIEGYLSIGESLLENLTDLESFAEAEAMIETMKFYAQSVAPERTLRWMVNCAEHLSRAQFEQQNYEAAEQNCRYFIQGRIATYGAGDPWALAGMLRLSGWLRLWDRLDEALIVDGWREAQLAQTR